ncbi:MAG: carbohydrate binding family 9 domain-containing protein [Candidatus Aminicenantes bacterium]|nr:carbohydrate binding family 9 domain-containing protein [Candidatus Aminicenantes bacterium]
MKKLLFWLILVLLLSGAMSAANGNPAQDIRKLEPAKVETPPVLDGSLDDEAWKKATVVDDIWITYNPVNGNELPQRTRAYLAYDEHNLYFAFHCLDSEPGLIKTSLTRRDNMFDDDWVGLSLDSVGGRKYGYEMFVNPSGAQGDIFRTGDMEDSSSDWVWHSAGRIVDDGYIVEIRQPLKSIRFASGKDVRMGVLFWRRISRLGMSGSWPHLVPGRSIGGSQAEMRIAELQRHLVLEALPTLTYSSGWNRLSPSSWSGADQTRDLGIGVKYGITSSIIAEATLNPDFSQVESDALQVTVNQRYPILYSEKRPFFMEAGNLFDLAGVGDGLGNMTLPVHTRTIIDPQWGLRLTGEQGRGSFALLASADRSPGNPWNGEENPFLGRKATFWIGRGKLGLGGDNYIGMLYSGREFGEEYNRALAADFSLRFLKNHQLVGHYIQSFSELPGEGGKVDGGCLTVEYAFSKGNSLALAMVENIDPGFRMDTAYYQRSGISSAKFYLQQRFVPDAQKLPWLLGVTPQVYGAYIHDKVSGMDDLELMLQLDTNFILKGSAGGYVYFGQECWAGEKFRRTLGHGYANLQPFKWLNLHTCYNFGDAIYYDTVDPFLGHRSQLHSCVTLQPTRKLNLFAEHTISRFRRIDTGEHVYTQGIWRGRLTYQFNSKFFVRGLVQHDSFTRRVLGDFLASFTYIPGTVLYLGYGSLNESRSWADGAWQRGVTGDYYYQTRQSLFFKVSYRYQF